MSKLHDIYAAGKVLTAMKAGDLMYVERAGTPDDYVIEGSVFITWINTLINTSVKTYTSDSVVNGAWGAFNLGAIATYTGFSVKAKITVNSIEYIVNIDGDYSGATATATLMGANKRLPSGLSVANAANNGGQFAWRIHNTTGYTATIQYRITEQIAV